MEDKAADVGDTLRAEEDIIFLKCLIAFGSMMNWHAESLHDVLEDLKMKVKRFMEEQEEENSEQEEENSEQEDEDDFITMEFGAKSPDHSSPQNEGANIAQSSDDHSTSPLIIQAGGVAPYHPVHNPCAPRPTFLRYGKNSPEFSIHKLRSILDIERSEEESGAKAESEAEADQDYNREKSQVMEECVNESHPDDHSTSPLIIQTGGVAPYHPVHNPCAPRPTFLRYGKNSPEFSIHKLRPILDIERSEEESGAKAESEAEADQDYNGEKSQVMEECVNESHPDDHSTSPLIIQAGGVAPYHPVHNPCAPRPTFLRYGKNSPEFSIRKLRPILDIERSEEESGAKAESEAEADQDYNREKSQVMEECVNESHPDDHSTSPLIIQAGGVAPYHPVHNPCAPRPTFLRYGKNSPEFSIRKLRPILDIERSEEESGAKAESEAEADQDYNREKSQVMEECVNESHGPQLAQDPPNLEDQISQITTQESKQAQEPDDTTELNTNSLLLLAHRINTSTVGFKSCRSVICKMMLPLFMLLVLVTVTSGFDLLVLHNNNLDASIVHHHSAHMNPLPLTERVSSSQKMKGFFLLWESPLHSECMGRIKNSSSEFVGMLVDSYYFCSYSSFSYLTSWMTEENWAKLSRRLIGTFLSFCQDILVSTRSAAVEIQGLCKSCPSKTATADQASKDESSQIIHVNSSTVLVHRSEEPTIDHYVHPEAYDQMEIVAEGEDNSTFCEKNAARGSQRVHFNSGTNSSTVPVYRSEEPTIDHYVHPEAYDQIEIVAEGEDNSTFCEKNAARGSQGAHFNSGSNSSTVPVCRSPEPTIDHYVHPEAYDQIEIVAEGEDNSTFYKKNATRGSQRVHFNSEPVFPVREDTLNTTPSTFCEKNAARGSRVHFNSKPMFSVRQDTLNTTFNTNSDLTYKLGLDHKSASKDETSQIVQGNSSIVPVYPTKEPTSFSIDVKRYVHPQPYYQIVAEDGENSTILATVVALAIMLILVVGGNSWRKAQEIEVTKRYNRNKPRQRRRQIEQTVTPTLGSYVDDATALRRSVRIQNRSLSQHDVSVKRSYKI
ncbi:hypothetical protein SUGI_0393040 [Cryptomeria japonica]|nr:hypothetical protein SUGI_0393040 [Cryptomeria japonica]